MADPGHRVDRLRLRHLRIARDAADRPAGVERAARRGPQHRFRQRGGAALDRLHHVGQCPLRRHIRFARWLLNGPVRPSPRADLEHPPLCRVGAGGGLQHVGRNAPGAAVHHLYRSLRRVCRRGGLAGRVVPQPPASRGRAGLHAGVFVRRRVARHRRLLGAQRHPSGSSPDSRRALAMAVRLDFRRNPGTAAHSHSTVLARIAGLAGQTRRRDVTPT